MSVSDSVSDSPSNSSKKHRSSSYGDGVIWPHTKPDGSLVWKVEITLGLGPEGKIRKTRRTVASKQEAIHLRRQLNSEKIQGQLTKKVSNKFEPFALHWVREVKTQRVRATTAYDYEYRVRQYLSPYFAGKQITEIKPSDIQRWLFKLNAQGLSTTTINGARRILYGIFKYAQRQGLISLNPVAATDALKKRSDEVGQVMPHWTRDEVLAVLASAKTEPDLDLFLHLAIHTGLRHGEILGLTWANVDLESRNMLVAQTLREVRQIDALGTGKVVLTVNPPKTKASRRVLHISDPLMAAFARHKMTQGIRKLQAGNAWKESDFVFTTSIGTPVSQANNLKRFKKFITEHGFRYVRVHDIRHTTAVLALEAGASLEWISQAFGHTGVEITKTVYAPYVQALNDKFVDALDKYLSTGDLRNEVN